MTYLEAIIFGIVQGVSEFLPISSTAHVVVTQHILGYQFSGLVFEIFLHVASVLAVIIYFRKDLLEVINGFFSYLKSRSSKDRGHFMFGIYILVATVITGVLGILLENRVQDFMKTPTFIAGALTVTGVFLIILERFHRYGFRKEKDMTILDAIIVGLAQTIAVLPGISRSGSSLVAALWVGLDRDTAVRYSFLLAIPVILGSTVLTFGDVGQEVWSQIGTGPLIASFLSAFIFSVVGIVWLIDFLKRGKLIYFSIYLFILAFFVYTFIPETSFL